MVARGIVAESPGEVCRDGVERIVALPAGKIERVPAGKLISRYAVGNAFNGALDCKTLTDFLIFIAATRSLQHADAFAGMVSNVVADPTRWKMFAADAQAQEQLFPALAQLTAALNHRHDPQALRGVLTLLRDTTMFREWPAYLYAVTAVAPSNWRRELVIAPERLVARGFPLPAQLDIQSHVCMAGYYEQCLGWQGRRDYWEFVRRNDPAKAWSAAVALANIEADHPETAGKVVPLLQEYFPTITNYPGQVGLCINILDRIGTEAARELQDQLRSSLKHPAVP